MTPQELHLLAHLLTGLILIANIFIMVYYMKSDKLFNQLMDEQQRFNEDSYSFNRELCLKIIQERRKNDRVNQLLYYMRLLTLELMLSVLSLDYRL